VNSESSFDFRQSTGTNSRCRSSDVRVDCLGHLDVLIGLDALGHDVRAGADAEESEVPGGMSDGNCGPPFAPTITRNRDNAITNVKMRNWSRERLAFGLPGSLRTDEMSILPLMIIQMTTSPIHEGGDGPARKKTSQESCARNETRGVSSRP